MNKFIKEILNFKRGYLTVQELIQYERLGMLSDSQIQDILSVPTEDARKLASVVISTLDARDIGKDMSSDEKKEIYAIGELRRTEFRESLCYLTIAGEYGDHLIALLPENPIVKVHTVTDELLVLADQQDKALTTIKNSILDRIFVSKEDLTNRKRFLKIYREIMTKKSVFSDVAFDTRVISAMKSAGNKDAMVNALTLYYSSRRGVLSNTTNGLVGQYDECIKHGSPIMECIDPALLDSYIEAAEFLKLPMNEYRKAEEEAKAYYLH